MVKYHTCTYPLPCYDVMILRNLYISLKFSSALPVFIVLRAIKNSLAAILVIFVVIFTSESGHTDHVNALKRK